MVSLALSRSLAYQLLILETSLYNYRVRFQKNAAGDLRAQFLAHWPSPQSCSVNCDTTAS